MISAKPAGVSIAIGALPQTDGLGLEDVGVALSGSGHVVVDGVSRTTARGVYAAGDCTGVLMLASVAAMQGRIAIWHALGDAVAPLRLDVVSANVWRLDGGAVLKPCEMPGEKVEAFLRDWRV